MNTPNNSPESPTQKESELSHDQELWDLLGKSSPTEASPLFSQNVVREIRIQEHNSEQKLSFWQKLLVPRYAFPAALAATALAAVLLWNPSQDSATSSQIAQNVDSELIPMEIASSLESSLESELLIAAANTPDLFSDEEVIAMLF